MSDPQAPYRPGDAGDAPSGGEGVELKPCPFCGGKAIIVDLVAEGRCVECQACGLETVNTWLTDAEAIADWNTRPIEDRQAAELEGLRAERDEAWDLVHRAIRTRFGRDYETGQPTSPTPETRP